MGALLKLVLGFAGGPAAWWATAVGWVYDGLGWCAKHWKIVLAVAALVAAFAFGVHRGKIGDAKLVAAANKELAAVQGQLDTLRTEMAVVNAEHGKDVLDVKNEAAEIDKKAQATVAAQQIAYNKIKKELEDYVAKHSKPAEPGTCPVDTDIGDDGVRLINGVRAARFPGAGSGN